MVGDWGMGGECPADGVHRTGEDGTQRDVEYDDNEDTFSVSGDMERVDKSGV